MPSDTSKRRRPFLLHNNKKRSASLILGVLLVLITIYHLVFRSGDSSSLDCRITRTSLFDSSSVNINNNNNNNNNKNKNNPAGNIFDTVQLLSSPSPRLQTHLQQITFQNLNTDVTEKETPRVAVMVVLPPWAIGPSLKIFFKQLAQQQRQQQLVTTHHTRLALLILNPASPTTIYTVRHYLSTSQLVDLPVDLYTKTYDSLAPWVAQDDHHDDSNAIYELAPLRKSAMARAKNFLLQSALDPLDDYVLWLDPLLAEFPITLIQDFLVAVQGGSVDILVPNTMIRKDGAEWGYDRANWQETTMSKSLQDTVPEDFVFMEGWWEYDTHRFLMVDMLSNDDGAEGRTREFTKVPLDGVGSTCLFIKAELHRNGLNFPAFPYQHQLDSEALAKTAKLEGYTIMGLPNYKIYHANMDQENVNGDDGGGISSDNSAHDDSVPNDEGDIVDDDEVDDDDDDDDTL